MRAQTLAAALEDWRTAERVIARAEEESDPVAYAMAVALAHEAFLDAVSLAQEAPDAR